MVLTYHILSLRPCAQHNVVVVRIRTGTDNMPHNMAALVVISMATLSYFFYLGFKSGAKIEMSAKTLPPTHKIKTSLLRSSARNEGGSSNRDPPFIDIDDANIPDCAKDVFVELQNEAGGDGDRACRGLLIRDDIIVTSKECSSFNFTFDFAPLGNIKVWPHAALNSDIRMADSRLGFLEANPPHHHYFVDVPARRTRVFLSLRSGHGNGTAALITCEDNRPIAHNFPVGGETVPIEQIKGVVPADILWEHTDIHTAPTLSYRSQQWWTRRISRKDEEDTFRRMIDRYGGPPGSISLPKAHSKFVSRASALCEAIDPRGHRLASCFDNYFVSWQEEDPFSGTRFFDWMDFGNGKFLLERDRVEHFLPKAMSRDEQCDKEHLRFKKVLYFTNEQRALHEIYMTPSMDGTELVARYKHNDEPVPETMEDDPHLYMWDLDERFYVVDDAFNGEGMMLKHSGLIAGRPALSGGKAYFGKHGVIWGINFSSGHYRPKIGAVTMMYSWMKDRMGFNTTAMRWIGRTSWSEEDCGKTDWDEFDIPGYEDAAMLERSCREVTQSPTWIRAEDV